MRPEAIEGRQSALRCSDPNQCLSPESGYRCIPGLGWLRRCLIPLQSLSEWIQMVRGRTRSFPLSPATPLNGKSCQIRNLLQSDRRDLSSDPRWNRFLISLTFYKICLGQTWRKASRMWTFHSVAIIKRAAKKVLLDSCLGYLSHPSGLLKGKRVEGIILIEYHAILSSSQNTLGTA